MLNEGCDGMMLVASFQLLPRGDAGPCRGHAPGRSAKSYGPQQGPTPPRSVYCIRFGTYGERSRSSSGRYLSPVAPQREITVAV